MALIPIIDAAFVIIHGTDTHPASEITLLNAALTAHANDALDAYLVGLSKPDVRDLYHIAGDLDINLGFDTAIYDEDFLMYLAEIAVTAAAHMG